MILYLKKKNKQERKISIEKKMYYFQRTKTNMINYWV